MKSFHTLFSTLTVQTRNQRQEKKNCKNHKQWSLNNIQVNKQWVTEEIKEEIKKYLKTNKNENTFIQNPGDAAKAILSSKLIVIQA